MVLGILKKSKDYFVGKTLEGKYIKVNNFELEEGFSEGQVIELDLDVLDYEKVDSKKVHKNG